MKFVKPSHIKGTVKAPASKSMMQRAIAAGLLAEEPVRIHNLTLSNDSKAALEIVKKIGAQVVHKDDHIIIKSSSLRSSGGSLTDEILNCGESGLGMRMFTPIASLWSGTFTITGEGSLLKRPVTMMLEPLKKLGVHMTSTNGFLPITVNGPLLGGRAQVDGSVSSQFLTGLLMALPIASNDSHLTVHNLKSTPYIDMTLALLQRFGIKVKHEGYSEFYLQGNQQYRPDNSQYFVEGDWSGASFLLVAGAIAGSVTVTGLDTASPQADRLILHALKAAGARVTVTDNSVTVNKKDLNAFQFDATHCPDLFPPLVALACNCKGVSRLTGVTRLTHKESNRGETLTKEFSVLGGKVLINGNTMEITGSELTGGEFDSHNDHRIAMAGAIAAVNTNAGVRIRDHQCVAKSYPGFFEDLITIGGNVDE